MGPTVEVGIKMADEFAELVLSRTELLFALNALQARHIVGVQLPEFDGPPERLAEMLREGEQVLRARSLLTTDPETGQALLSPGIVGLVGALAFRSQAFPLVRGVRGLGRQLFVFNRYQDTLVEHTLLHERVHRLAVVPTLDDLWKRVQALLPLYPVTEKNRPRFTMDPAAFDRLLEQVQANGGGTAVSALVDAGWSQELATRLVRALQNPLFTFSLAYLECKGDKITQADSLSVFADEQSAWGLWLGRDEAALTRWRVFPTGINDVWGAWLGWLGYRPDQDLERGE